MSFQQYPLSEVVSMDPSEPKIKKGSTAKKILLENIIPFTRKIDGFEIGVYNGGSKFRNKDVLFSRISPTLENGKVSQVTILEPDEVAFGSTEFIVLRAKEEKMDPDYLYYLSISKKFVSEAVNLMTGTSGRKRVSTDGLKEVIVSLPNLNVQKSISNRLSMLDEKIELNLNIIRLLEEYTQILYYKWFIKFDFPHENNEPYKCSGGKMIEVDGKIIPDKWKFEKLNSMGNIVTGKTPKTKDKENFGKDFLFITPSDMDNQLFITKTERLLTEKGVVSIENNTIDGVSVIVSCIGIIGKVSLVNGKCATNQQINSITDFNVNISPYFAYLFLKSNTLLLESRSTKTVMDILNKTQFSAIPYLKPEDSIMEMFHNAVEPFFQKMMLCSEENIELEKTRDLLIKRLIK